MVRFEGYGSCSIGHEPDRAQSLTISSTDGMRYTVKATPALDGPGGDSVITQDWAGEPAFNATTWASLDDNLYWHFKVVAPGQAEFNYAHVKSSPGVAACTKDEWSGVLTRVD